MKQEANLQISSAQVVVNLSVCTLVGLIRRLDLDDQLVVNDHVKPLVRELFTLVHDTNADFPPYLMTASSELALQGHHIDVLEKAEAECVVNLEKRADYGAT